MTNSASTTTQPGAARGVAKRHRCAPNDGDAPPPRAAAPATIAARVVARLLLSPTHRVSRPVLATGSLPDPNPVRLEGVYKSRILFFLFKNFIFSPACLTLFVLLQ